MVNNSAPTVLIIEDELDLQRVLHAILTASGFKVISAADGIRGMALLERHGADAVILDVGLPGLDGWQVLTRLREKSATLPILMLTARSSTAEKVHGLSSGANDYMVKPVPGKELVARINAAIRTSRALAEDGNRLLVDGPLELDPIAGTLRVDGKSVSLSATEWRVMVTLLSSKGGVHSATELLESCWGYSDGDAERVKYTILRLRRALTEAGLEDPIETIRSRGYRWSGAKLAALPV